jgi:hypothetical protein
LRAQRDCGLERAGVAFEVRRIVEHLAVVVGDHADDRRRARAAGGERQLHHGVLERAGAQVLVGRTRLGVVDMDVIQVRGADAFDDHVPAHDARTAAAVAAEAQVERAEDVVHVREAGGVVDGSHQAHVARLGRRREAGQRDGDEQHDARAAGGGRLRMSVFHGRALSGKTAANAAGQRDGANARPAQRRLTSGTRRTSCRGLVH